ncbi:HAD hydrolase-like protein [Candidatus Woesearchaeota archaeon]|nr:HAD hydrolase-like protein [Candidatus Woesearchaeota archaeon]
MIKAIITDCMGVVVSSPKQKMLMELSVQYDKDLEDLNVVWKKLMEEVYKNPNMTEEELFEQFIMNANLQGMSPNELRKMMDLFMVANKEMLQWLKEKKKNYVLFMASNNWKERAEYLRKKYSLDSLFEDYFWGFTSGVTKSSQEYFDILKESLAKKGIHPEDAVMIDNKKEYLERAKKAGFQTILFETVAKLEQDFQKITGV